MFCCLSLVCMMLDPTHIQTSPGCRATFDQRPDLKYRATHTPAAYLLVLVFKCEASLL